MEIIRSDGKKLSHFIVLIWTINPHVCANWPNAVIKHVVFISNIHNNTKSSVLLLPIRCFRCVCLVCCRLKSLGQRLDNDLTRYLTTAADIDCIEQVSSSSVSQNRIFTLWAGKINYSWKLWNQRDTQVGKDSYMCHKELGYG